MNEYTDIIGLSIFLGMIYLLFAAFTFGLLEDVYEEDNIAHKAALWPLLFIKFLLKSLYLILFTDWKVK